MNNLSDKAKIVYATLEQLGASTIKNKVTSYAILDYIVEQNEELYEHQLLQEIPEEDFINITLDMNLKSISAILTSLNRKNIIESTPPTNIKVDGTNRNLKQYFLKN